MQRYYNRSPENSFMVLEGEPYEEDYTDRMLRENDIAILLAFYTVQMNKKLQIWYDITGKRSLRDIISQEGVTFENLEMILRYLAAAWKALGNYLINEDRILVDPDSLFFSRNAEVWTVFLCYCPMEKHDAQKQIREMLDYLMKEVEPGKPDVMEAVITMYDRSGEAVSFDEMLEILEDCRNGRSALEMRAFSGNHETGNRAYGEEGSAHRSEGGRRAAGGREADKSRRFAAGLEKDGLSRATGCQEEGGQEEGGREEGGREADGSRRFAAGLEKDGLHHAAGGWGKEEQRQADRKVAWKHLDAQDKVAVEKENSFWREEQQEEFIGEEPSDVVDMLAEIEEQEKTGVFERFKKALAGWFHGGLFEKTGFGKKDRDELFDDVMFDPGEQLYQPTMLLSRADDRFEGKLVYEGYGRELDYVISKTNFRIGSRDEHNDAVLHSPAVSRQHARIMIKNGDFFVEDLNSKNGTYVNGQMVEYRQSVKLNRQDLISFADVAYRIM